MPRKLSQIREGGITQDEYDKKAYELKQKQYEINNKESKITKADEEFPITLIRLIDICSRAYELFEISKVEQKRQLINFVLSNLQLRGKKLEFEIKKPFDLFVNLKNVESRFEWLGIVDKVKTFLLCVNGDIFIPEQCF